MIRRHGRVGTPGDAWARLGMTRDAWPGDACGRLGTPGDAWGRLGMSKDAWGRLGRLGTLGDAWGRLLKHRSGWWPINGNHQP
jgi:hypothetical protein